MKTENAFKGLSINPNNETPLNYKSSKGKGKVVDRRSWEDLLEENEGLKQQLETTRDCWSTDKRVLESKVKNLEEKLKEVLEKGNKSLEQEIGDSVHVSNAEIESNSYEKLYKAAKEELRRARPLIQVGRKFCNATTNPGKSVSRVSLHSESHAVHHHQIKLGSPLSKFQPEQLY